MIALDMLQNLVTGNSEAGALTAHAFRPFVDQDSVTLLEYSERLRAIAFGSQNFPILKRSLQQLPPIAPGYLPVLLDERDHLQRHTRSNLFVKADRRLAATALAIRLYASEHRGEFPQKLKDLVPNFLPAVPIDPSSPDDRSISYKNDRVGPVLYILSDNGIDDGGSETPATGLYGELDEWGRLDRVFYLTARTRETVYVPQPPRDGAVGGLIAPVQRAPWVK